MKTLVNYGDTLLTLGIPGSGKTYMQQLQIHRLCNKDNQANVFIITPNSAHDYASLIKAHEGEVQVFPHIAELGENDQRIKELCHKTIADKKPGLFYQAAIGTMAGSREEVQRNAWNCINVIADEIRANPQEKYILTIDDVDVLFCESVYPFHSVLLDLMQNARENKNCAILLAGNWEDSIQKGQSSLLLKEPNVSVLYLPIMHHGDNAVLLKKSKCSHVRTDVSREEHYICSNAPYWIEIVEYAKNLDKRGNNQ